MTLEIQQQDLMTVDSKYVICHCISADCAMGAGVVVPIKKKYEGVKNACRQFAEGILEKGGLADVVGNAYRYECPAGIVYNLFTKERYMHKAGVGLSKEEYHDNLRTCLQDMRGQMKENGERYLAMPKIASGLDRCKWDDVVGIIEDVFKDADIDILVCVI